MNKTFFILTTFGAALGFAESATTGKTVNNSIKQAMERAIPSLQKVGPAAFKNTGCVSCHAQSFPAMALANAKANGYAVDENSIEAQRRAVVAVMKPAVEVVLEGSDVVPQLPMSGGMLLMGLAAAKHPGDKMTAAVVQGVANRQNADGSWTGWSLRPPMSGGDLRETAYASRAIDLYAPAGRHQEMQQRLAMARNWLLNAKAESPEEEVVRLMGLQWTHASQADIRKAAAKVIANQQPDGGWRQLATRESDAFATGEALVALIQAGAVKPGDSVYQRGANFLLRTQSEDGTWRVATRAYPFQPFVETGFPHGRDQWISATATSWAVMALAYSPAQ
jgi:hypothetical protein